MDQIARNPKQVGDALRRRRRIMGLTQTAVAEKAHLRQATISAVETGGPSNLGTLFDVLAALDLELVVRPRTKGAVDSIEGLF